MIHLVLRAPANRGCGCASLLPSAMGVAGVRSSSRGLSVASRCEHAPRSRLDRAAPSPHAVGLTPLTRAGGPLTRAGGRAAHRARSVRGTAPRASAPRRCPARRHRRHSSLQSHKRAHAHRPHATLPTDVATTRVRRSLLHRSQCSGRCWRSRRAAGGHRTESRHRSQARHTPHSHAQKEHRPATRTWRERRPDRTREKGWKWGWAWGWERGWERRLSLVRVRAGGHGGAWCVCAGGSVWVPSGA